MRNIFAIHLVLFLSIPGVFAAAPIEDVSFDDPEQEERYYDLICELRCPKCLNANLCGSDAPIAENLRAEVREQMAEGRTDAEIKDFMTARYGDFILYKPRLTAGTAILWFGPLMLLIAGFFILRRMLVASRNSSSGTDLSPDEMQKLRTMLDDEKDAR